MTAKYRTPEGNLQCPGCSAVIDPRGWMHIKRYVETGKCGETFRGKHDQKVARYGGSAAEVPTVDIRAIDPHKALTELTKEALVERAMSADHMIENLKEKNGLLQDIAARLLMALR